MADIHISRSGTTLGIFPEEEVREGLRTARFAPTDLGWREGMSTWLPLAQFPEFASAGAPPAAPGALPSAGLASGASGARTGLPWDRRQELGLLNAFIETLKLVLSNPTVAFSTMQTEGGLAEPLIYAVIGGSAGFIVYFLFSIFFGSIGMMSIGIRWPASWDSASAEFSLLSSCRSCLPSVSLSAAAILHLCLTLVGGARRSFETTFRVLCFAAGSTYPLMIIPLCGGLISGIWCIVLQCIGLARAHDTTTGKAALAVFLPLAICCGGSLIIGLMFGTLGALFGHHH